MLSSIQNYCTLSIELKIYLTLRGWAREELVSKNSLNKVEAVLSQICDYSPVSVN